MLSVEGFEAALAGMATPAAIAVALALTTLLLEDLAIAAGVALAAQGLISWGLSITAVGAGIALGDLGLYALGVAAARWPVLQRRFAGPRTRWVHDQLVHRLGTAVLLARVIPGLRLATYTASGFLRVPLPAFAAWVVLAVAAWTLGLYALSAALGHALAQALGLPLPVAVALPIVAIALALPLWQRSRQRFERQPP